MALRRGQCCLGWPDLDSFPKRKPEASSIVLLIVCLLRCRLACASIRVHRTTAFTTSGSCFFDRELVSDAGRMSDLTAFAADRLNEFSIHCRKATSFFI